MASYITVKVLRVPGSVREIALNGERTVGAALREAGIKVDSGFTVQIGSKTVDSDTTVKAGQTIVVAKNIKGN
jgi:hypothetical protein